MSSTFDFHDLAYDVLSVKQLSTSPEDPVVTVFVTVFPIILIRC
jgi:hypothetical protein